MPFATGPVLTYVGAGRYVTVGPTVYVGTDETFTIPTGFPTDLASVPRIFWGLIPPTGVYEKAAVLHDWMCLRLAAGDSPISSHDVDGLFRRVMREAGVGLITRWVMWTGVRWGALTNPARRVGWWRDAPAVVALTGLGLAVVCAAIVLANLAVDTILEAL